MIECERARLVVSRDIARRLKLVALQKEVSMYELVESILTEYLEGKNGKKRVQNNHDLKK